MIASKKLLTLSFCLSGIFFLTFIIFGCSDSSEEAVVSHGNLVLEFNDQMYSKISSKASDEPLMNDFMPTEYVTVQGQPITNFNIEDVVSSSINDSIGAGSELVIIGKTDSSSVLLSKKVTVKTYNEFPDLALTQVTYTNKSDEPVKIEGWRNNGYTLSALNEKNNESPAFWTFQSGSYSSRPDWVLPVDSTFEQDNYMGMNASDYGGGTPVTDIWRKDAGVAVGHVETEPWLVSLPVKMETVEQGIDMGVALDFSDLSLMKANSVLQPDDSLQTITTFVTVHQGDYYSSLQRYAEVLKARGLTFTKPPETAYEPIWCAWGYERDFTLEKVLKTIPKVKELGFEWVVLDDGWQISEGDWTTNSKFDDMSMKQFVDEIHQEGLKAKLWWAPLAADSGSATYSKHPEYLLVNRQGNYQDISWWDSFYLNPADSGTVQYTTDLVKKFMGDWGYDGLKIDGQHLNQVPPHYGKSGDLAYPEKSVEKLPDLYSKVYDTATDIKSDAVVEICPCGTAASSFVMAHMNQPVSSDPLSSWQIRHKGKTYKAVMGSSTAYYGDHVELSDNASDFASTVGIGGVVGSKFTWPEYPDSENKYYLTPEREKMTKKWVSVYKKKMLPKATYRGRLYDIGYDKPEAHAIEKADTLYYAFYAKSWDGQLELRGLDKKKYEVKDYIHNREYGEVTGSTAKMDVAFKGHLLLEAVPVK